MRNLNEQERIAARRIARNLLDDLKSKPWYRPKNEAECSAELSKELKAASVKYGIDQLWIKAFMMRIQRGIE